MNVYWSIYKEECQNKNYIPSIHYHEPEPIFKLSCSEKFDIKDKAGDFRYCPAFKDYCKNTFALKMPMDYRLSLLKDQKRIVSDMYDQSFFENTVLIRSIKDNMFSIRIHYIFFAEESLEIENNGAHFSDSEFARKTRIIPGKFDVGKWFRPLDCAILINKNEEILNINNGDVFSYVKFLTDEEINLKRFVMTDELTDIVKQNVSYKRFINKKFSPLSYWYDLFKSSNQKKYILKHIKNNLME